jgi:hypothetical protein
MTQDISNTMTLWCARHGEIHTLPLDDVERTIYALQVALVEAQDDGEYPGDPEISCPMDARTWARSPELYAEQVDACVERREQATR